MSTGVPAYITVEGPLYVNALVAAERARNEITGFAAVVLRASAATAQCLDRALTVLQELGNREVSPPGLPHVLYDGVSPDGERVLVLDDLRGEPIHDGLSRLKPVPEASVLQITLGHTRLLGMLHDAGYSGLRPWAREAWWDEDNGEISFLGWEWLVKGRDAAGGDVRAAAALWIEIATCVPPTPDLTVGWGSETWLALPLGTRRCLYEIWQEVRGFTANELEARLSEWSRQMTSTPAEQLAEGLRLLEADQPGEALEWLDRAQRVNSPSREVRRAYSIAAGRLKSYVESLLFQARKEVAGYYSDASCTLSRAIGLPHINPQLMLKVHRWQAAAQALADAAVKLAAAEARLGGLRLYDLLEKPLLEILTFADTGDLTQAAQQIEACMQSWEKATGISIPQLKTLHAELSLPGLWHEADEAEGEGQFDRTVQILTACLALEGQISYLDVLYRAVGRLRTQSRRTIEAIHRFHQADELARQAQQRLEQGDDRNAQALIDRAVALTRDAPGERAEFEKIARMIWEISSARLGQNEIVDHPNRLHEQIGNAKSASRQAPPAPVGVPSEPVEADDADLKRARLLCRLLENANQRDEFLWVLNHLQERKFSGIGNRLNKLRKQDAHSPAERLYQDCWDYCKRSFDSLRDPLISRNLDAVQNVLERCDTAPLSADEKTQVKNAIRELRSLGYEYVGAVDRVWDEYVGRSQARIPH